jgi:hypothetical protein
MSPQPGLLCAREPAAPSIGIMVVLKEGVAEQLLENLRFRGNAFHCCSYWQ